VENVSGTMKYKRDCAEICVFRSPPPLHPACNAWKGIFFILFEVVFSFLLAVFFLLMEMIQLNASLAIKTTFWMLKTTANQQTKSAKRRKMGFVSIA
jgi:uncharacterized protein YpmS